MSAQARLLPPQLDRRFVGRFNEKGPYYTSYPVLGRWSDNGFGHDKYVSALREFFGEQPDAPIYLYLHIPFCAKLCWYCLCNIQISNNRERIQKFVDALLREIELLHRFVDREGIRMNVREIHLGGGTPSHLDNAQVSQVIDALSGLADIRSLNEFAMEIDPRTIQKESLAHYASLGVDRISFGVQDFDPTVQEKINRVQPFEMVRDLLSPDIRRLFSGVNFDLLYGLPAQTLDSFRRTVELTTELDPSRVTLLKYAHVPDVRKHMKMIDSDDLPKEELLPFMFTDAVQRFVDAGYVWVGIDNFAKPGDALAKAVEEETVGRNFGGPTAGRAENIIGLGPSSTMVFGRYYFQNLYDTNAYSGATSEGRFPTFKGYQLSEDDLIRREVIFRLHGSQAVNYAYFRDLFDIEFETYFSKEMQGLSSYLADGLIVRTSEGFRATTVGRFFIRHICRTFDRFLENPDQYRIHGP